MTRRLSLLSSTSLLGLLLGLLIGLALASPLQAQPRPKKKPSPSPRQQDEPLEPSEAYAHAVTLIQSRKVKEYPEARRLLLSVPKGHKLYVDARAYLEWVDADILVRTATQEFRSGKFAPAFAKLDQARKAKVLGPQARASVDLRRERWRTAIVATRKGIDYVTRNQALRAKMELRPVAENAKLKGVVRRVAQAYLAQAEGKTKQVSDKAREFGRKLLRLDPKLLVPPPKPKPPKKPKSKKSKDGWTDDWGDEEWKTDDWDDSKPKKR